MKPSRSVQTRVLLAAGVLLALLASPAARAERLPVRTYTTADGLWSSVVFNVVRDSHGFMWFCTRDGLSRFDGYAFVNYRLGGAVSQTIYTLLETHNGIFWIVGNSGGLYRYDPRAAAAPSRSGGASDDGRPVLDAKLISPASISSVFEDREGNLWASGDKLLRVIDGGGGTVLREVGLNLPDDVKPTFYINGIVEGRDGSLWLPTNKGLLRRLPDGRVVRLHSSAGYDYIPRQVQEREGRIWFGHPT